MIPPKGPLEHERDAADTTASSPFAPSPSAPPPSADDAAHPVRVPPPTLDAPPAIRLPLSSAVSIPPSRAASTEGADGAEASEPHAADESAALPIDEPLPSRARTPPRAMLIAAGAALLLVATVTAAVHLVRRTPSPAPETTLPASAPTTSSAAASAASTPPNVPPPPAAPSAVAPAPSSSPATSPTAASASGAASDASSVATRDAARPRAFDARTARAALDARAASLHACKLRSAGHVKVTFAPNGHVTAAKILPPHVGARQGQCVVTHLEGAHIAPFVGPPASIVYAFH